MTTITATPAINILIANSNTICRALGLSAILGSAVSFVNGKTPVETEAKVSRLTVHNAVAALGAMLTLATLTTNNVMGTKTRLFCLATTAAVTMYPTVAAKIANLNVPNASISTSRTVEVIKKEV